MFCTKCGSKLDENGACANCASGATSASNGKMVKVVINRVSSFVGCAVSYKVFVDGNEVAKLANGGSQEIMLPAGTHKFAFDMWSASNVHEVVIPDNCSTFYVDTKLSMGLLTNKITIVSTRVE